jgi:hypothetical protein
MKKSEYPNTEQNYLRRNVLTKATPPSNSTGKSGESL